MNDKPQKSQDQLILLSLISFICQIILWVLIHDTIISCYSSHYTTSHVDVGWGMAVELLFYDFIIVAFFHNVVTVFFPERAWVISMVASVVFFLIVIRFYDHHPLRSLNIIGAGVLAIWAKYVFDYVFRMVGKLKFK